MMLTTNKLTAIAAALSCALITPIASAINLPAAYSNNPNDYRVAYESIAAHLAAGQRDQVVAELPRIGITGLGGSDEIKFRTGLRDINWLLDSAGYSFAELAPPPETAPMLTLTPATQPITAPQDGGAAAAMKTQLMQQAQAAGEAVGKSAPIPMVTLTPATQPAQQPPTDNGAAAAAKTQLQHNAMQAGTRTGMEATAANLQQQADAAKQEADHSHFVSRIEVPTATVKQYETMTGEKAPYAHDSAGYYRMTQSDDQRNAEIAAQNDATRLQQAADQLSADVAAMNQPQGSDAAAATKTQLMNAARATGTAAGKSAAATLAQQQPTTTATEPTTTTTESTTTATEPTTTTTEPTTTAQTTAPQGNAADVKAQLKSAAQTAGTAAGKAAAAANLAQPLTSTEPAEQPKQQPTQLQPVTQQSTNTAVQPVQMIAPDNSEQVEANRQAAASAQRQASSNSAAIADHTQRLDKLDNGFKSLREQVEDNRKESRAGIAGAISIANLPQVTESQKFGVSAAVGGYEDQNALAVGLSARPTDNTVVKVGVTTDTNGGFGYGAGAMIGW